MPFRKFLGWFVVCWVLVCVPLAVYHSAPGVDTPNHIARLHILGNLTREPGFAEFYRSHWVFIPNLGIDLVLTPFVALLGFNALTLMKVFIGLLFGLTTFGFAWLNREAHGKWTGWGLMGFVLCYGYVLGFGFINYLFGICLGILLLAAERRWRNQRLVLALGMPILLSCHLMAFGLFLLTYLLLAWIDRMNRRELGGFFLGLGLSLLLYSQASRGHQTMLVEYDIWVHHLQRMTTPFVYGGQFLVDIGFQVLVISVILFALYRKEISMDRRVGVVFLSFIFLTLIAPHYAFTSAFISARIPIWLLLVSGAMIQAERFMPWLAMFLLVPRTADITRRHVSWNRTLDQIESDLGTLPVGSMLFQAIHWESRPLVPISWHPPIIHADCLAVLHKPIFVSNIFTLPAQQPLLLSDKMPGEFRDHYPQGNVSASVVSEISSVRDYLSKTKTGNAPAYLFFVKHPKLEMPVLSGVNVVMSRERYVLFRVQ
jgi:hypothetical protein